MTDIFLRQGEPNPSDVRLQDPTAASGGASTHEIDPVGLANLSAFGLLALNGTIAVVGIASAEALGAVSLNANIGVVGLANVNAFGAIDQRAQITLTSLANSNAAGTVSLNANLAPAGVGSTTTLGAFALNGQINPAGFADADAFGVPTIVLPVGAHEIDPVGISSAATFGSAVFGSGVQRTYGQPVLRAPRELKIKPEPMPVLLMPVGVPSVARLGVPTIRKGAWRNRRLQQNNSDALMLLAA